MLLADKTFSHLVFLIESINYLACAFINKHIEKQQSEWTGNYKLLFFQMSREESTNARPKWDS